MMVLIRYSHLSSQIDKSSRALKNGPWKISFNKAANKRGAQSDASDPHDFIFYLYISSLEVSRVFLECGVTNQSPSIIDFQWLPLCIKIIALCLVMHYANWLIESQVWELLFKSQFGFSTDYPWDKRNLLLTAILMQPKALERLLGWI